ncbi:2-amino-4-hydroxy-6-hydroxymethyldihydropteridine diphosphokinase [Bdellovibrionota bacterium]
MVHTVYIGVGANSGDRLHQCRRGIAEVSRLPNTRIGQISSFYETEPVGCESKKDWFINAVIEVTTEMEPDALLEEVLNIETTFGRVHTPGKENQPRPLDLDILLFDNLIIETERLTVPHPRLHERKFVLLPLNEIAPQALHSKLEKTASELLSCLQDEHFVGKVDR